jgi:hypothetical protein
LELLDTHWRTWLDALAPVVETSLKWKGGFVSEVHVATWKLSSLAHLIGHPAWRTVRSIRLVDHGWLVGGLAGRQVVTATLLHPIMASLESLGGILPRNVIHGLLQGRGPQRLQTLELRAEHLADLRIQDALRNGKGLPELKVVDMSLAAQAELPAWWGMSPLGSRVRCRVIT